MFYVADFRSLGAGCLFGARNAKMYAVTVLLGAVYVCVPYRTGNEMRFADHVAMMIVLGGETCSIIAIWINHYAFGVVCRARRLGASSLLHRSTGGGSK